MRLRASTQGSDMHRRRTRLGRFATGTLLTCTLAVAPAAISPVAASAGSMTDLGTLGGAGSEAVAINDRSQVAGMAATAAGDTHAFRWSASSGMQDLGTLPGMAYSEAVDINDSGQVLAAAKQTPPDPNRGFPRWDGQWEAFRWTASAGVEPLLN